ncbi:MAG TPA: hypothetical protein VK484_03455 [Ferruginibacter sp.]|nr:hypothetical protein [Ferruginibacter sp.]
MLQFRKYITALGLLLVLVIPLFFSVTLLVKQKILHFERNKKFEKEILQTISVSVESIYWVKPEKEILFKGKLFDVKSHNQEGDIIYLLGFFDHKEDELVKQIVDLNRKNPSKSPFSTAAIKFLFYPVYISQPQVAESEYWKLISKRFYLFDEVIPVSYGQALFHPPEA